MSTCISMRGEYSEHEYDAVGDHRFVCRRCWVFDEEAALQHIDKLQAAYDAKVADFARETLRVSAGLQACDANNVPIQVVGEAMGGYYYAQQVIAKAIERAGSAGSVTPERGEQQ
jgi:hypothetical protein